MANYNFFIVLLSNTSHICLQSGIKLNSESNIKIHKKKTERDKIKSKF